MNEHPGGHQNNIDFFEIKSFTLHCLPNFLFRMADTVVRMYFFKINRKFKVIVEL